MIIDCHYHLDPEMVPLDALLSSMDRHGLDRAALIPRLNPPLHVSPLLQKLAFPIFLYGLHRATGPFHRLMQAIYQFNVKADATVDVLGKRYAVLAQPPNQEVADAVAAHPDRFYGWICVNPRGPSEPLAEIEKFCRRPGMIGVKAHPYWHDYPVERLRDAAAWCEQHGKPMLIHLGLGPNGDYQYLPKHFPRLNIIYAHAGIPYSREVCALAGEKNRVFVDLACTAYVDLQAARMAIAQAGAGKCLFGSDGPYFHDRGKMMDFAPYRSLIETLGLSAPDQEKVLGKNFLSLIAT